MPDYKLIFTRSARKALEQLPAGISDHILDRIEALSEQPRPRGAKKLKETSDHWRLRVGDYRVIYRIDDREHLCDIMLVRRRDEAYR